MDKIVCTICEKEMDKPEWDWGEEDAHKECVIDKAEKICSKECGYLTILDEDECRDCGAELRILTEEDKNRLRR